MIIRFSEEEFDHLNTITAEMRVPREAFVRSLVGGIVLQPLPSKEMLEIIGQLRRIGNNINQLSVIANKTGSLDTPLYKEHYSQLQKQITEIKILMQKPAVIDVRSCR